MNILKINGTAISGIYVDAAVSFNKPAKRVQSISVPGRNGNLIIDEGAFDNVLISYPVYEKNSFPMEFDSIVNWLASLEGYQRIECSNDPTHFRLGRFVVPQTPTAKRLNRDGYYQLSFDCKPQRYLNLGEVPMEIDANPSETYGPADIVSFEAAQEDTISGAEFSIVPQQDLHGYDSPWPAGGGKNLLENVGPATVTTHGITFTKNADGSVTANGTNDGTASYYTIPINLPAGNYYFTADFSGGIVGRIDAYIWNATDQRRGYRWDGTTPSASAVAKQLYEVKIESGKTQVLNLRVSIIGESVNNLVFKPMICASTETDPTFAPYENVCPISGWAGANVTRNGKNLCPVVGRKSVSGVVFTPQSDGSVIAIGTSTAQAYAPTGTFQLPAGTYKVYGAPSGGYVGNNDIYVNVVGVSGVVARDFDGVADATRTFTITETSTASLSVRVGANQTDVHFYPMICLASETATDYEPYTATTIPITWTSAGTVYGGTLQYMGGNAWRLTKTMESVDMGTLPWTKSSSGNNFYASISPLYDYGVDVTMLCSQYVNAGARGSSPYYGNDKEFTYFLRGLQLSPAEIYVHDEAYSDAVAFKTAMSGVQLVYELATPVVYDLTGEELARIVGQNNVFANCGQSTVVITEPTYFVNPGYFASKSIIRVYGDGTFRVGDNIITIEEHDEPYIDIDSELQDCYCGDTNMNEYVTFTSGEYPVLVPGSNYVLMGEGITKLVITPNWWEL